MFLELFILTIFAAGNISHRAEASKLPDYENCVIETENPNDVPWSAMLIYQIGNQPKYFQPVAIIDKNIVTIHGDGDSFRAANKQLRILPSQNYTLEIHRNDELLQKLEVSHVQIYPNISQSEESWLEDQKGFLFIYLKQSITFTNQVRHLCLNSTITDNIIDGKILLSGWTSTKGNGSLTSYFIGLHSDQYCRNIYHNYVPNGIYGTRVCGYVMTPDGKDIPCIRRSTAATIADSNNKTYLVGFLNNFLNGKTSCGNQSQTLIYISLLKPEMFSWANSIFSTKCKSTQYSCSNSNLNNNQDDDSNWNNSSSSCLELTNVCDGVQSCDDGSDESLRYCKAQDCCYEHEEADDGVCTPYKDFEGSWDNYVCTVPEDKSIIPLPILIGSIVAGAGVILFVAIMALIIVRQIKHRQWYLTKEEEEEFFNGITTVACDIDNESTTSNNKDVDCKTSEIKIEDSAEENDDVVNTIYQKLKFNYSLPKDDFVFDISSDEEGKGVSGIVYKGQVNGKFAAIKLPKNNCDKELFKTFLDELKVMAYIKNLGGHQNIVNLIGAYTGEIRKLVVYVGLEFCDYGCLSKYLVDHRDDYGGTHDDTSRLQISSTANKAPSGYIQCVQIEFNQSHLQKWAKEIAQGMAFLSKHKIIHGDLAIRNILLDSNRNAKIADFGLSRKTYYYTSLEVQLEQTTKVPWKWMAPEALVDMKLNSKSDVWSFGVTLWEIFSLGAEPYGGLQWNPQFAHMLSSGVRLGCPQEANNNIIFSIMENCWNFNPNERPKFESIVELLKNN